MEGLRGLPLPPDLQQRAISSPPVAIRSGVFDSDRLRLGWFVYITLGHGRAVLLGTLHPTVYSRYPPFVFELAYLEPDGWVVSFDCPPLFSIVSHEDEGVRDEESNRQAWLYSQLEGIKHGCSMLTVPLPLEFIESQRWMSPTACVLSSTQVSRSEGQSGSDDAFLDPALYAFRAALSAHLNGLVTAELDASPRSVSQVASIQAEFAASRVNKDFLGSDALVTAFGPAFLSRLRSGVLDDAYGLAKWQQSQKDSDTGSYPEYYYIDPRMR